MLSHHIPHHVADPHLALVVRRQRHELYIAHSISRFALSLVSIFVPIYLLTLGYGVSGVIKFFAAVTISIVPLSFLVGALSRKLGIKHIMFIWLPSAIGFLLALDFLDGSPHLFYPAAILGAINSTFYWLPLHSLFARSSDDKHGGEEVAKLHTFSQIATIAAPLIGGFMISSFGFKPLFIMTIVMLFVSIMPIFATPEIKPHVDLEFRHGLKIFRKYPKIMLGSCVLGANEAVEDVIWPVFVYLLLQDISSVGVIGSLLGVGYAVFALITGKLSDASGKKYFVRVGAAMVAAVWFFRALTGSETEIYASSILMGASAILLYVPFAAEVYRSARESKSIDEFIIFREVPIALGRIFVLVLALVFAENLQAVFAATGLTNVFFWVF